MTTDDIRWVPNPLVIFRDEFDGAAMLFDPQNRKTFALDDLGVFIWKCLDGNHGVKEILARLATVCGALPESAGDDLARFIDDLVKEGLVVKELNWGH